MSIKIPNLRKFFTKSVDGKYVIGLEDACEFDNMIEMACTILCESDRDNKRLRLQNTTLEAQCVGLQSKLDQVKTNLCVALDRKVDENQDVMHLINVCAALVARESEYRYLQEESENKLKLKLDRILAKNQAETSYTIDKFKEKIRVRDTKISDLTNDIHSIQAENDEKNATVRLLQEKLENTKQELCQGKVLIAGQVNRLEGRNDIDIDKYRFAELMGMVTTSIENKNIAIHEYFLKMQCTFNELLNENKNLKISMQKYTHQLVNEKQNCVDGHKLINTLKSRIIEQEETTLLLKKKYKQATCRIENLTGKTISC